MKKTLAILLAAVMLLAMSAVAMAATPTGNITVTGIENTSGMTATAYKIIGWNLDTDTNEPLDPANVWADSNIPAWLTTNGHSADIKDYDGTNLNVENKVFNHMYQDLGTGLKLNSSKVVNVSGGMAAFEGLDIGTYLIKISGENAKYVYSAVVANVGYNYNEVQHQWKPSNSIAEAKAYSIPDIDKKINKDDTADGHDPDHSDTVEIGEVVTFDIYAPVPNYPADAAETYFRIYDIMCAGLTFNADSLKVNGVSAGGMSTLLTLDTEYHNYNGEPDSEGKIFDFKFEYNTIKNYSKIHITYTATVNENAEFGTTNNKNEATLKYQNNPYIENDYDEKKDEVRVFTFKLNVDKVDGKNESIRLAGAEFELYRGNENAPSNDKVNFVLKSDGVYRLAKAGDTNTVTKLITTTSGNIKVEGLKDGVYWLKETKAPAEYNKAAEPFKVQLIQQKTDGKGTANLECGDAATEIKHQQTVKVVNNKGTIIPSTGGMGTTVFMVAGIVIMACAVVTLMLLLKRQKNGSEG